MKKVLTISILAVMLVLMVVTGVNAANNDNLAETLYNMGAKYGMTKSDKVKIERYLADYPVTESEANAIVAKAEEAVKVMEDAGVTDYTKLFETVSNNNGKLAYTGNNNIVLVVSSIAVIALASVVARKKLANA